MSTMGTTVSDKRASSRGFVELLPLVALMPQVVESVELLVSYKLPSMPCKIIVLVTILSGAS